MDDNKKQTSASRRNFLVRAGSALTTLILGIACSDKGTGPVDPAPPEPTPTPPTPPPTPPTPPPTPPEPPPTPPEPPEPPEPPTIDKVDVIVVGAGLSGLVAAYELDRAGHDVRVLEARNEAGGRAQTLREPFDDGLIAETGPARIPPDHDLTLGYIDHFGIETSPFYTLEGEYLRAVNPDDIRRETPEAFLRGRESWLKIPAGTDALPMAFANSLGNAVRTGLPVTRVVRDETGVVASYGAGGAQELRANHLICTVPLPVIDKIVFDPILSEAKRAAFEVTSYLDVTRVYVQYAQRSWENHGLNGWGLSWVDGYQEIWHPTWNQEGPRGILMSYMFAGMANDVAAMDPGAIVPGFIDRYDFLFPGSREHAEHGTYFAWEHQPWIGSAFALSNPPFSEHPSLASPEGPIHFAGEHASGHRGWMQGALQSGLRAAREIDANVTGERRATVAMSRRQMMRRIAGIPDVPEWLFLP